jgi:hypothetical protein
MTATTALTAQNTLGVFDIHYTPPDFVRKLIEVCISDVGVDVVKTGINPRLHFAFSKSFPYLLTLKACWLRRRQLELWQDLLKSIT